jgi:hypothetical protein
MKQRIYIDTSVVGGYFLATNIIEIRTPKEIEHYGYED